MKCNYLEKHSKEALKNQQHKLTVTASHMDKKILIVN